MSGRAAASCCEVRERPDQVPRDGDVLIVEGLGKTEIGHPHIPLRVENEVAGFDVPMQGVVRMGVGQCLRRLQADLGDVAEVVGSHRGLESKQARCLGRAGAVAGCGSWGSVSASW